MHGYRTVVHAFQHTGFLRTDWSDQLYSEPRSKTSEHGTRNCRTLRESRLCKPESESTMSHHGGHGGHMPDMGNHLMTNHSMTNHSMINMTNTTMGTDHTGTGMMDHASHGAGQVRTNS